MKKTKETQQAASIYVAPKVTVICVNVEKGFAITKIENPAWRPGEENFF